MRPIFSVLLVAVVAVVAYQGWQSSKPLPDPEPPATQTSGGDSTPQAALPIKAAHTPQTAPPAGTETNPVTTDPEIPKTAAMTDADTATRITAEAATPSPSTAAAAPSFDVVRISPQGRAVMAGRAEPGAEVEITVGGTVIATVTADERGEWVALPETAIEPGNQQLALTQRNTAGETVESESVVFITIPERHEDNVLQDMGALVVLMPRNDGGKIKLLQEPTGGIGLKGSEDLSLDTIEYDDVGSFALGGRAKADSEIAAYVDNQFIGNAKPDVDETWKITPVETISPGLHQLRIDQTDATGKVIARLETPFSRAEFLLPAESTALVVVQPGNSLWRIARSRYGLGPQYVQIFEANRDQIANPDLIYPGQIFELPTVN